MKAVYDILEKEQTVVINSNLLFKLIKKITSQPYDEVDDFMDQLTPAFEKFVYTNGKSPVDEFAESVKKAKFVSPPNMVVGIPITKIQEVVGDPGQRNPFPTTYGTNGTVPSINIPITTLAQ